MASMTSDQFAQLWTGGISEKFALYAVKLVNAGDTFDLASDFRIVIQTAWMGATVSGVVAGTQASTVVTAPNGLTNAGAYVLVQGVAR